MKPDGRSSASRGSGGLTSIDYCRLAIWNAVNPVIHDSRSFFRPSETGDPARRAAKPGFGGSLMTGFGLPFLIAVGCL